MDSVKVYMTVASLPSEGIYYVLEKFIKPEKQGWSRVARQEYCSVLEQIASGAVQFDGISPYLASTRVLPYFMEMSHPTGKLKRVIDVAHVHGVITGPAGTDPGPDAVRLCVIGKEGGKVKWTPELMAKLPGGFTDIDTLDARSSRDFLEAVASCERPAMGEIKLVAVPLDEHVRLTRNLRGEYVTQVPKVWA